MRNSILSLLLLCCLMPLSRSEGATTKLKPIWLNDFKKAKAYAEKYDRPILMNFTGSDWCGWCIKLKKEVFDEATFKTFASKYLILFEADFPRKTKQASSVKAQNNQLKSEFKITGYPSIYLVDSQGKTIAKTGYKAGGARKYVEHLIEYIKAHREKQNKAESK